MNKCRPQENKITLIKHKFKEKNYTSIFGEKNMAQFHWAAYQAENC